MEILAILRVLWNRRLLIVPGVLAAIAVAVLVAGEPPQTSGYASVRVLLDTRPSQLVATVPAGADSLGWRAQLLADRLIEDESRQRVARELGVDPETVRIVSPELATPLKPTAITRNAVKAEGRSTTDLLATLTVRGALAMVQVEAAAPDRDAARRLAVAVAKAAEATAAPSIAEAAVTPTPTPKVVPTVEYGVEYGLGAPRKTDAIQPYKVVTGPVRASTVVASGGGKPAALVAAIVVLIFWSGAVLALDAALRGQRRAA